MAKSLEITRAAMGTAEANLKAADHALEIARDALIDAEGEYRQALWAVKPRTAADYKIVISGDDSWGWSSVEAMLDDTQGDYTADDACGATWQEHFKSKAAWLKARAAVEAHNQAWIDAWHGNGIACYHAALYSIDPISGEFSDEPDDTCGGFFSIDGAPIDAIRDQLEPRGFAGKVAIEEDC